MMATGTALSAQQGAARWAALVYGVVCYATFVAAFGALVLFLGHFGTALELDRGPAASVGAAVVIDVGLVLLFGVSHSVMARPAFKRRWTRIVPPAAERSTYVLVSSLCLLLMVWQWRPLPGVFWDVGGGALHVAITAIYLVGWAIVGISTLLTNHFDLFGLRQVYLYWRQQPYTHVPFRMALLYRLVRHPMMVGVIVLLWATPVMSGGRLLLAAGLTVYILVGVRYEERDLARVLGEPYRAYQAAVPRLWPRLRPWRGGSE